MSLPSFKATPTSIADEVQAAISQVRYVQDELVKTVSPLGATFENVLVPLLHAENAMHARSQILSFYQYVSENEVMRDASSEAQKLLKDFALESALREDLFKLIDAVNTRQESLGTESGLLLSKMHKEFLRSGIKLSRADKTRYEAIQKQIIQLSTDFQRNLSEPQCGDWFKPEELEGISDHIISTLDTGSGDHEGRLFLTTKIPHLIAAATSAKNGETRKRVSITHENSCPANVPLLRQIVLLRDEAARLLDIPITRRSGLRRRWRKDQKT